MRDLKFQLQEQAIALRKRGFSYHEIMAEIPVAKSTISLWLRSVGLTKRQKQRLTEKKLASIKRGWESRRRQRIQRTQHILGISGKEVGSLTKRELWLMGVMLYWAEGSKEKDYSPGTRTQFTNTDPDMIRFFLWWLEKICDKTLDDVNIDLYIHNVQRFRTKEIADFWVKTLKCDPLHIKHIYYKYGNPKTLRKNTGLTYRGTLRIAVKKSSMLTRQIAGWTRGVVECLR